MKHRCPEDCERLIARQMEEWGCSLGEGELEKLAVYVGELSSYDRANVIGEREPGKIWLDHVLDALSCVLYSPLREVESLLDVGSGGGMPGVPLHVALGLRRTCLLESTGKKVEFLERVAKCLRDERLEVLHGRAEDLGHSAGYRASFEAATVRAVARLDVVAEYCLPFLERGGIMVAMKGRIGSEERDAGERAVKVLGGSLEEVIRVPISRELEQKERYLVVIKKEDSTPQRFPRKPGTPKKVPLGDEG